MNAKKKDDFAVDTGGVSALFTGLSGRFGTEVPGQPHPDGTTADRHDGTTAPEPAAAPKAPKPSKYTILFDQDDALVFDGLALELRRQVGRPVDKSEIVRALVHLAARPGGRPPGRRPRPPHRHLSAPRSRSPLHACAPAGKFRPGHTRSLFFAGGACANTRSA
ncbi:hypothetical protein PV377_24625 [Streptomyces ipomoeae]|uniref:hypothetical protein n=1 Tax=Streptomyces ipomoeae TaxID=103232 RepID=UPI0029AA5478|nr:hypothetical protein [Streptomyces ipomoeae]MDX2842111.1 hypothetical protein [Streptomyces ipomoeae]